jgi:hypothetical protein
MRSGPMRALVWPNTARVCPAGQSSCDDSLTEFSGKTAASPYLDKKNDFSTRIVLTGVKRGFRIEPIV